MGACLCEPSSPGCTWAKIDLTSIDVIRDYLYVSPSDGAMRRDHDYFTEASSGYGGIYDNPSLRTKWLADAPTGAGCRVEGFTMYTADLFKTWSIQGSRSDVICTALGQTVAVINGMDPDPSLVSGDVTPFSPTHEWVYKEDGSWDYVKISEGSKEWCEYDKACNHLDQWHPDAADENKCVTQYQPGGAKGHLGMFFCAQCDGPSCWQISKEARCGLHSHFTYAMNGYPDSAGCTDAGGRQVADEWGNMGCQAAGFDGSESTCFDLNLCPKTVQTYIDWEGIEQSYTSYGFCEWMPVCYDASASTRESLAVRAFSRCKRWRDRASVLRHSSNLLNLRTCVRRQRPRSDGVG